MAGGFGGTGSTGPGAAPSPGWTGAFGSGAGGSGGGAGRTGSVITGSEVTCSEVTGSDVTCSDVTGEFPLGAPGFRWAPARSIDGVDPATPAPAPTALGATAVPRGTGTWVAPCPADAPDAPEPTAARWAGGTEPSENVTTPGEVALGDVGAGSVAASSRSSWAPAHHAPPTSRAATSAEAPMSPAVGTARRRGPGWVEVRSAGSTGCVAEPGAYAQALVEALRPAPPKPAFVPPVRSPPAKPPESAGRRPAPNTVACVSASDQAARPAAGAALRERFETTVSTLSNPPKGAVPGASKPPGAPDDREAVATAGGAKDATVNGSVDGSFDGSVEGGAPAGPSAPANPADPAAPADPAEEPHEPQKIPAKAAPHTRHVLTLMEIPPSGAPRAPGGRYATRSSFRGWGPWG